MSFDKLPSIGSIRGFGSLPKMPKPPSEGVVTPTGPIGGVETRSEQLESMAKQGVIGSLPERLIWAWLERSGLMFMVQESVMGGKRMVGGQVLDFVIYGLAPLPVALRVQGSFWHGPGTLANSLNDDLDAQRLVQNGYIVLDLWEADVYTYALTSHLKLLIDRELAK